MINPVKMHGIHGPATSSNFGCLQTCSKLFCPLDRIHEELYLNYSCSWRITRSLRKLLPEGTLHDLALINNETAHEKAVHALMAAQLIGSAAQRNFQRMALLLPHAGRHNPQHKETLGNEL